MRQVNIFLPLFFPQFYLNWDKKVSFNCLQKSHFLIYYGQKGCGKMGQNESKKTFTEKIAELMIEKNVTRKNISDATGIPVSTINNWFARNEDNPNTTAAIAVAKFFEVSVYYLCDNTVIDNPVSEKNPFSKYLNDGEAIAFHLDDAHDASDLTEDEIKEVIQFIDFVRHRRKSSDEA